MAALYASAGKAGADAPRTAGVGVAVLQDDQPKLAFDARYHQAVGGCVVAVCVAVSHCLVAEGPGRRNQAAVLPAKLCAVEDQSLGFLRGLLIKGGVCLRSSRFCI